MGSDLNLEFHQMTYPAGFAQRYLSGLELWGEALVEPELAAWFEDEREGYANLGYNATSIDDGYEYDELSRYTGWRHLPERRWRHALGLGSATGVEFLPVAGSVDKITIVEPSQQLRAASVGAVALNYAEPQADGSLSFPDGTFDLVVCFGVLHHIAKVSKVIDELGRCTAPGGYLLIREPIISMGDWRRARVGLTARERGIPLQIFRQMIAHAGLGVVQESLCGFRPVARLRFLGPRGPYSSRFGVRLDRVLATISRPNYRYHARNGFQKVRPAEAAYVLHKPGDP